MSFLIESFLFSPSLQELPIYLNLHFDNTFLETACLKYFLGKLPIFILQPGLEGSSSMTAWREGWNQDKVTKCTSGWRANPTTWKRKQIYFSWKCGFPCDSSVDSEVNGGFGLLWNAVKMPVSPGTWAIGSFWEESGIVWVHTHAGLCVSCIL